MENCNENNEQKNKEIEVKYQHQESANEEYFECMNEYIEGRWCV